MVHVLRDPRDRHASVMSHRGGKRAGVLGTTAVSVDSERRARHNASRYGSRYMVLRYEDLVSSPETYLTAVCDLIEVSYPPSLIAGGSREEDRIVIHAGSVGRYVEDTTPFQVAMIERLSRSGLRRRGYPLDRPELSTPERLRLALGAPVGWVFLRAWRPWSWLKSRFSRGPSQRRLAPEAA